MSDRQHPKKRSVGMVTAGLLAAATCLSGLTAVGASADDVHVSVLGTVSGTDDATWRPVHTLYRHRMAAASLITTDSGAAVAAWSAYPSDDLLMSVRRGPHGWTAPRVVLPDGAAAFTMAKGGGSAWALGQNGTVVSVVQVGPDGHIGEPEVVGASSDNFIVDPVIGFGASGAGAAAWNPTTRPRDALLAYRTSTGEWQPAERVPVEGAYLEGIAVDAAGTAGVVFRSKGEAGGHRGIYYIERHADGSWSAPELIGDLALRGTVAANGRGDLAVAYTVGDWETAQAYVRYRPAGEDFRPPLLLSEKANGYTNTPLSVADDGTAAAIYVPSRGGPARLIRTDAAGNWSAPEELKLTLGGEIASNAAGDLVIYSGDRFVRCPAGASCGSLESDPPAPDSATVFTVGPEGAINVLWYTGCERPECSPDLLQVQRGR